MYAVGMSYGVVQLNVVMALANWAREVSLIAYFPFRLLPFGRALRLHEVMSEPKIRLKEAECIASPSMSHPIPTPILSQDRTVCTEYIGPTARKELWPSVGRTSGDPAIPAIR